MTKWIFICVGILLLLLLVACGSGPQVAAPTTTPPPSTRTPEPTAPAPRSPQTATPSPTPLLTATVPHVTAEGRLSFVKDIKLTFGTSGKIDQVNVSELDKVTKGQVLTKLDTTSLEQAVKEAEFGVKAAELALKSAEVDLEQAQDDFRKIAYPYTYQTVVFDVPEAIGFMWDASRQINDAVTALKKEPADISAVSVYLQQALHSLDKSQGLLHRGYGTDVFGAEYLPMEDFWTMRAAQLQADKAQLAVDKANNDVDIAKNDLDSARNGLEKAVIVAPFDGVIAQVNVKEGDVLSSGNYANTIAIEIIDPIHMELNAKVNELDIPNMKLGQKVTISVHALPDTWFEGVITSISSLPVAESGVVSYEVKVGLDVPQDSALKAGMTATADIIAGE